MENANIRLTSIRQNQLQKLNRDCQPADHKTLFRNEFHFVPQIRIDDDYLRMVLSLFDPVLGSQNYLTQPENPNSYQGSPLHETLTNVKQWQLVFEFSSQLPNQTKCFSLSASKFVKHEDRRNWLRRSLSGNQMASRRSAHEQSPGRAGGSLVEERTQQLLTFL